MKLERVWSVAILGAWERSCSSTNLFHDFIKLPLGVVISCQPSINTLHSVVIYFFKSNCYWVSRFIRFFLARYDDTNLIEPIGFFPFDPNFRTFSNGHRNSKKTSITKAWPPLTKRAAALGKYIRNILPMNPIHRLESMNYSNLDRTFTPICITTDRSVYPMATNDKLLRHAIAKRCVTQPVRHWPKGWIMNQYLELERGSVYS